MSQKLFRLFVSLMIGLAVALAPRSLALASSFTVNSTTDAVDTNPGDGVCATNVGECTLRAAIQEANALPGDDTITLPTGTYTLTLAGINEDASATGDLDITGDLTVNGTGATSTIIDGNGSVVNDRVIHINGAFTVNITGVTITGGNGNVSGAGGDGILNDMGTVTLTSSVISGNTGLGASGILNAGTMTLINSTVSGNSTSGVGGGIDNRGSLSLVNSTVSGNTASSGRGGGIRNEEMLMLTNSTVSENAGGGIYNPGGTVYLDSSAISSNTSFRHGAGISNTNANRGGIPFIGTLIITNSTFSGNSAAGFGGGIYSVGIVTVTNSTFSNNSAGSGGGVYNGGGSIKLKFSTVNNNVANEGGGIYIQNGTVVLDKTTVSANIAEVVGGILQESGELILNNSTVSSNAATKLYVTGGGGIRSGGNTILTITNSTISNNTTNNFGGSGIENFGTLTLNNVTITGNGGSPDSSGFRNWGTASLTNSLIAGNYGPSIIGRDCDGTVNSQGYNLIQDMTSRCIIIGDTTGNLLDVAPLLGPLQDNGGPTFTHALLPFSPAIDAGNPAGCTDQDGNLLTTDQRGISRPQGTQCDIGAFEFVATIDVSIDIKPGSYPNAINLGSNGVVPVAVLTTDQFDASDLDPATVIFAGTSPLRWFWQDVDWDGEMDLLFHFNTLELQLDKNSTEASLTGKAFDGMSVEGKDSVKIVP